jgi:hypothetical protein
MEQMVIFDGIPAVPRIRKFSEFCFQPLRGRENNAEQNTAAEVSDSNQIESFCRGHKNLFLPPWLKVILFNI